jgi:hypothetical protein
MIKVIKMQDDPIFKKSFEKLGNENPESKMIDIE